MFESKVTALFPFYLKKKNLLLSVVKSYENNLGNSISPQSPLHIYFPASAVRSSSERGITRLASSASYSLSRDRRCHPPQELGCSGGLPAWLGCGFINDPGPGATQRPPLPEQTPETTLTYAHVLTELNNSVTPQHLLDTAVALLRVFCM